MKESHKIKFFKGLSRVLLKPIFGPPWPYGIQRAWFKFVASGTILPKKINCQSIKMGTIEGDAIVHSKMQVQPNHLQKVILYLHGGAYCICAPKTHRSLTFNLAKKTQAKVFVPDYRLAPEHPFPAGINDCLSSYQWLLDEGYSANNITLAGDSAGGGLVMATAQKIRDLNINAPNGLILISPWTDLTLPSLHSVNDKLDPLLRWPNLIAGVNAYLQGEDATHPLASSSLANLNNLPPILIQVGSEEILLNDAHKLNKQALKFSNDCTLNVYQDGWHVFQLQAGLVNMSDQAINEMDQFISKCMLENTYSSQLKQ